MILLIHREFIVNARLEVAWQHLARVERWPSWAKHIKHLNEAIPRLMDEMKSGREK